MIGFALSQAKDPWIEHAKRIIFADDGVHVSLEAKNKDLIKFGRSNQVQTTDTTLMTLPSGTYNETYVSTNIITSLISTSASDTTTVVIEGHTISGTDLTFVSQTATLTGQTAVTLTTALARCTRIYASGAVDLIGTISVCETDTYTAGVPDTPTGVHCQIRAGQNQSEKASTSLSSVDYWVITHARCDLLEKTATSIDVDLEIRLPGKVFRPVGYMGASEGHDGVMEFRPYLIVKPNSDVRLRARASANGKSASGMIFGVLLKA